MTDFIEGAAYVSASEKQAYICVGNLLQAATPPTAADYTGFEHAPKDLVMVWKPGKDARLIAAVLDQASWVLERFLHENEAHPDWEYETTTGPRKAWDGDPPDTDDDPPGTPEWENNTDRNGGFERFDYHEEAYWRRPKTKTEPASSEEATESRPIKLPNEFGGVRIGTNEVPREKLTQIFISNKAETDDPVVKYNPDGALTYRHPKTRGWFYPTRYNEQPGRYEDEEGDRWTFRTTEKYPDGGWYYPLHNEWYQVPTVEGGSIAVRWVGELNA